MPELLLFLFLVSFVPAIFIWGLAEFLRKFSPAKAIGISLLLIPTVCKFLAIMNLPNGNQLHQLWFQVTTVMMITIAFFWSLTRPAREPEVSAL